MADVSVPMNPAATDHLPIFVVPPGASDWLLQSVAVFLIFAIIGVGVLYLKLHSLPEQMAHRGQVIQFELVAVLGLISLFTHNHMFWIAGLLLALVPLPDFRTPLESMASSLGRIAGVDDAPPDEATLEPKPEPKPEPDPEPVAPTQDGSN